MRRTIAVALLALALQSLAQDAPLPAAGSSAEDFARAVYFGKKFADMGDYASAYDHYARADVLKPDQSAVLYNMAVVLARAGRYSEAQVKVDRYLQLFPAGAEKINVGRLQLELDFQRELQKKRQLDQEYADLFNRGKFLYGRGELADALRTFQQAEALRPDDAAAIYNEAVVFEKLGDYAKAIGRFRRYSELESDPRARAGIDERIYTLQSELDDMKTKIVCSFCGRKLPIGATWCERCWHGPYLVKEPVWSSRPCAEGASATRSTYFADERFHRNDILPCMFRSGSMLEELRYSPARQREIQNARRSEGWKYNGDILESWADKSGNQIRYQQGRDYLEKVTSGVGGEILTYAAHAFADGIWLLDREDLVIDAQRYTSAYAFDAEGRILSQRVDYQNTGACNHLLTTTADFKYANGALSTIDLKGGYDGFAAEGSPKTSWQASVAYTYDEKRRVTKEELAVTSMTKTYMQKAQGELRDDIHRLYPTMRIKRPIEKVERVGDLCASSGSLSLSNAIDLRPFYTMSPNLTIALPNGITRAVVAFTYPQ